MATYKRVGAKRVKGFKTSTEKTSTEKMENQISNYEKRLGSIGEKKDTRNIVEKVLNLKEGQNALFDVFELISRPQQAVFGAIDALQNNEDVGSAFLEGGGGSKTTSGGKLLRNAGMKDSGDKIGLDDILGGTLDILADPIDLALVPVTGGTSLGVKAAMQGGKNVKKAVNTAETLASGSNLVRKAMGGAADVSKIASNLVDASKIPTTIRKNITPLQAGLKLSGKAIGKGAKITDNIVEKALGTIDANQATKLANATEKFGEEAVKTVKATDYLDTYKNFKKGIVSAIDSTKALPGNIISKAKDTKAKEDILKIQGNKIIDDLGKDVDTYVTKKAADLGVDATTLKENTFKDMLDLVETNLDTTVDAKKWINNVTPKNNKFKGTTESVANLQKAMDSTPFTKGIYTVSEDGKELTVNVSKLKNKEVLRNNPEISKMFSDVKLERERLYTPEQLARFDELKNDPEFMEVFDKHKGDFEKYAKVLKQETGVNFGEIVDKVGYARRAEGTLGKQKREVEAFNKMKYTNKEQGLANTKSFGARKSPLSALETETIAKESAEKAVKNKEATIKGLTNKLYDNKKAILEEKIDTLAEKLESKTWQFNENLSKVDATLSKTASKLESVKNAKNLINNELTDKFIDKASKMQDEVLADNLFKASDKVTTTTKEYNTIMNKLSDSTLEAKETDNLLKKAIKLDEDLAKQNKNLEKYIARAKGTIDNNTLSTLKDSTKAIVKNEDLASAINKSNAKYENYLEVKKTLRESHDSVISNIEDNIRKAELELDSLDKVNDPKILQRLTKEQSKLEILKSQEGLETYNRSFESGLKDFINNSIQTTSASKIYNDALLEGSLLDKDLVKFAEDLTENKIPAGMTKVSGDTIYNQINSFKNLLPENSEALMNFAESVKGQNIVMSQPLATILGVAENLKRGESLPIKFINAMNNTFKKFKTLTPGFQVRNATGNFTNMYLSGVPAHQIPIYYKKAGSLLSGDNVKNLIAKAGDGIETLSAKELKDYKLLQEFVGAGFYRAGTNLQDMKEIQEAMKLSTKLPSKALNKVVNTNIKMNESLDEINRLALLMYAKENPKYVANLGKTSAADAVKFALFDPSNMTGYEQDVVKKLIPFYNFTKQNLLFQTSNVIKNTPKYNRLIKSFNEVYNSLDEDQYRQYQKEAFQIPLPFKDDNGNTLFVKSNLPLSDLGEYMSDPLRRVASSVTPVLKAPIEKVTGQDIFTGQPITKNGVEQVANYLGVNTISTDVWKKINALSNSELSDNEKWAEVFRSILQNTNEDKVKNNKLYEELEQYQTKVKELKNQGIDVPTIRELTSKTKLGVGRLKKKRTIN